MLLAFNLINIEYGPDDTVVVAHSREKRADPPTSVCFVARDCKAMRMEDASQNREVMMISLQSPLYKRLTNDKAHNKLVIGRARR